MKVLGPYYINRKAYKNALKYRKMSDTSWMKNNNTKLSLNKLKINRNNKS